jgi:hypothetical protein
MSYFTWLVGERNNPPSYLFLPVLLVIIGGILKLLGIILFRIIKLRELTYSAWTSGFGRISDNAFTSGTSVRLLTGLRPFLTNEWGENDFLLPKSGRSGGLKTSVIIALAHRVWVIYPNMTQIEPLEGFHNIASAMENSSPIPHRSFSESHSVHMSSI